MVLAWAVWTRRPLDVARHERKPLFYLGCLFAIQLAFMNIGQDFTTAGHAVVITDYVSALDQRVSALLCARGPAVEGSGLPGRWWRTPRRCGPVFERPSETPAIFFLATSCLLASAILLGARQVYTCPTRRRGIEPQKLLMSQSVVGTVTFVAASLMLEPDPYIWTGPAHHWPSCVSGRGDSRVRVHRQHLWLLAALPAIQGHRHIAGIQPVFGVAVQLVGTGRDGRTGTLRRRRVGHRRIVHGTAGGGPRARRPTDGVRRSVVPWGAADTP